MLTGTPILERHAHEQALIIRTRQQSLAHTRSPLIRARALIEDVPRRLGLVTGGDNAEVGDDAVLEVRASRTFVWEEFNAGSSMSAAREVGVECVVDVVGVEVSLGDALGAREVVGVVVAQAQPENVDANGGVHCWS